MNEKQWQDSTPIERLLHSLSIGSGIDQHAGPDLFAVRDRLAELEAENARLRYLLYAVLEEQACGIPDRVISDTLENEILSATKGVTP